MFEMPIRAAVFERPACIKLDIFFTFCTLCPRSQSGLDENKSRMQVRIQCGVGLEPRKPVIGRLNSNDMAVYLTSKRKGVSSNISADVNGEAPSRYRLSGTLGDTLINPEIDRQIDSFVKVQLPFDVAAIYRHARGQSHARSCANDHAIECARDREFSFCREHGGLNHYSPSLRKGSAESGSERQRARALVSSTSRGQQSIELD